MRVNVEAIAPLERIAEQGLAAAAPHDEVVRGRLEEMSDFCEFALEGYHGLLEHWSEQAHGSGRR